jgi:hypothetical protein
VGALLLCQPDSGEMGLEVADQLIRSAAVDMVAVDSVAALVPRAEIEGEIGQLQGEAVGCGVVWCGVWCGSVQCSAALCRATGQHLLQRTDGHGASRAGLRCTALCCDPRLRPLCRVHKRRAVARSSLLSPRSRRTGAPHELGAAQDVGQRVTA